MKHFKYLVYILKHKWYVFIECWKRGYPWLGLIHDWSKFRWSEWFPYVDHFYGKEREEPDPAFSEACHHHQQRNKHHWQFFLSINRRKEITVMEMPPKYIEEMLADWIGAARAKGQGGAHTPIWYDRVKDTLILGRRTHLWVEHAIDRLREGLR